MSGPPLVPVAIPEDPEEHERIHVHEVYDKIAPHFSSTRYKPWPIIARFLNSLPPGSVGLDSGTGNGKYLPLPSGRIWTIGLDKSRKLLEIAQAAGGQRREVVWGDALGLGWRRGAFDYAISIATIHHLATPARRQKAIETLLQLISPAHGRLLIYVWAVEQDHLSKRVLPSQKTAQGQDVFVPWVMPGPASSSSPQVFNRYYHMFVAGELEELAREAVTALGLICGPPPHHQQGQHGVEVVQSGWERSNWYIELKRWNV